jgi:heptosyltransferase-2
MKRVVVLAPNWLGDAVMALPAIADVRRDLGDAAPLDVAAPGSIAPLFTLAPTVGAVVAIDRRAAAVTALREKGYDTAILLPNSFASAVTAWRAGICERWGYRNDFRAPLLTRAITPPAKVHQAEYYQHLVRALGFASGPLEPRLTVGPGPRAAAETLLAARGWDRTAPLVAVAPGAAYGGAKRWPGGSFASLIDHLDGDGIRAVLVGTAADATVGAQVLEAAVSRERVIDLIGRTDLTTLAGVLLATRALVTNDSGAMHLAAALDVSVTAMFGPTNERETRPLGSGTTSVLTRATWCRPCMLRECPLTHGCMRGITVDQVLAATRSALQ